MALSPSEDVRGKMSVASLAAAGLLDGQRFVTAAALFRDGRLEQAGRVITSTQGGSLMFHRSAAWLMAGVHQHASRIRRADGQSGQGTVEYVGLAMSIGVLPLAVSSFLSGKDHGIGSIITGALKSAIEQASGGAK
jgi:hypothetical protein